MKKGTKTLLIVLLVIFLILGGLGYGGYLLIQKGKDAVENAIEDVVESDIVETVLEVTDGDITVDDCIATCEATTLSSDSLKQACIDGCNIQSATDTGSIEYCLLIETDIAREACIVEIAEEEEDPSLCEQNDTVDMRDLCYTTYAGKTEDTSVCVNVENSTYLMMCEANGN